MIVLAIDTTTDQASVALQIGADAVTEEVISTTDGHSHVLFPMIEKVLAKGGISLNQVDCFASAMGPGSFTGVRICLTAAKGLAEATGQKAVGISNLRALATFGSAPLRAPVIDARRGQIYTAVYDSALKLVSPEILIDESELILAPGVEKVSVAPALAAAIALCARISGPDSWMDPSALDAHYVRRMDADHFWVDRAGISSSH